MKKWKRILGSFQVQLLLSYLPLMLIFFIWTRVYVSIQNERDQLGEKLQKLEGLENRFLENNAHLQAFLLRGYRDPSFYDNGSESNIDKFISNQLQLQNAVRKMKFHFAEEGIDISRQVDSVFVLNTEFVRAIEYLKSLMYERGFSEYGQEGKVRAYAHWLEDSARFSRVDLLQLRRFEKDFLRRGDTQYVAQFNKQVELLQNRIPNQSKTSGVLRAYQQSFNRLVDLDRKIGVKDLSGAYARVQDQSEQLGNFYAQMVQNVQSTAEEHYNALKRQIWLISILMVVLAITISIYLSKDLTRDIRTLNKKMFSFIKSQFETYRYRDFKPRNTEIANLNRSFDDLITELRKTLERMQAEKQRAEKTAEYKSLFLANMSHEIRTPLNGVIGMLHMLQSTRLTQKQRQYMDVVEYSANHLLDLVNMILDHSKMDAKKLRLEKIEFDLAGDMSKLLKIFEFKAREKRLDIQLELEGNFQRKLLGDSLRLQQVLINLLNNALKFTETGKVCLEVKEVAKIDGKRRVRFAVSDTGIGISAEHQKRLFEAFEQLDGSTTRQYGGTGLGLAISNQLVSLMGGQLQVQSELDKGTTFWFELELEEGELEVRKLPLEPEPSKKKSNTAYRVLLAEDNPVNQKVLSLMLEQNGAEVRIAANGKEAVAKYREEDFDIILMDLQMPEMDGLEATEKIKGTRKYKNSAIPIIAVTANAFSEDRSRALAAGMDDFLTKPIRPQEFKGMLAKYAPGLLAS